MMVKDSILSGLAAACLMLMVLLVGFSSAQAGPAGLPANPDMPGNPVAPDPDRAVPMPPLPDIKQAVTDWLLSTMPNPQAYEPLDWSQPVTQPYGGPFVLAIRHVYRYLHGEYGLLNADDIFYMDADGQIAGRTTTTWKWRHNWWGRGWEKYGPAQNN